MSAKHPLGSVMSVHEKSNDSTVEQEALLHEMFEAERKGHALPACVQ